MRAHSRYNIFSIEVTQRNIFRPTNGEICQVANTYVLCACRFWNSICAEGPIELNSKVVIHRLYPCNTLFWRCDQTLTLYGKIFTFFDGSMCNLSFIYGSYSVHKIEWKHSSSATQSVFKSMFWWEKEMCSVAHFKRWNTILRTYNLICCDKVYSYWEAINATCETDDVQRLFARSESNWSIIVANSFIK